MAYRSYFLRSTCLVFLIALCFGAIGAVQAAPPRYSINEKFLTVYIQEDTSGQLKGTTPSAQAQYTRAEMAGIITSWKGEVASSTGGPGKDLPSDVPSLKKSTNKAGINNPERSPVVNRANEHILNTKTMRSPLVSGTGTVVFVDLEGGFFGLIADDGTRYLPDKLPESCQADGMRVKYTGKERAPAPNIRMWGTPLRILSATPLGEEVIADGRIEYIDLEGGFYGIVTTGGACYLPLNLPAVYQVDGLLVSFTARTSPGAATIQMWGTPVTLVSITAKQDHKQSSEEFLFGEWTLKGMERGGSVAPLIEGSVITAIFTNEGKVTGTSGCNLYSASYEANGGDLAIGPAISTEMYCDGPTKGIMKQESTYLHLLGMAASWEIREGDLVVADESGRKILVFSPGIADASDQEIPLVEFWRTGGFAGMNDHLQIFSDGTATLTRKEYTVSFVLTDAELEQVRQLLDASGFTGLSPEYHAPPGSADLFLYQVRAQGRTVLAEDTAVPPTLQPLIGALTSIVNEHAPDDIAPPLHA